MKIPGFKYFIFWVIGVVNMVVITGQTPVTFERYSTLQGLPQNSVFSISQDASGFIWLATYDGISRFDGFQFVSYKPEPGNIGGLSSNITVALEADDEDKLWVGTTGSGLSVFNTRTLTFENYLADSERDNTLSDNNVNAILPEDDFVWVGTENGLSKLNRSTNHFTVYTTSHGLAGNNIISISRWRNGKNWIATNNGLQLISFDNLFEQHAIINPSQTGGQVLSLHTDIDGRLWTVSANHLSCFREKDGEFDLEIQFTRSDLAEQFGSSADFLVMEKGGDNNIWLGTQDGLYRLVERDSSLQVKAHYVNAIYDEHSLPGNQIVSLKFDQEGVLWIGTRFNGLAKFDPYKQPVVRFVHNPSNPNSIHSNDVRAISEDADGNIWIGSRNQGLDFINTQTGDITHFPFDPNTPGSLINYSIRDLYLDREDRMWVGYYSGFAIIDRKPDGEVTFNPALNESGDQIFFEGHTYFFYEDSRNRFWVATSDGLILYSPETNDYDRFVNAYSPSPYLGNFFRSVCEDKDGYLWLATDGIGVFQLNPETGEFTNFRHFLDDQETLSHNKVYVIERDKNDDLWFGTHSGLNRLCQESGIFHHYTQEDGLSNNIVYGILPDDNGFLWLTTANGLSRFNPDSETFKTYLTGFEFSDDAFSISRDGKIYVGGLNGFFAFHPDSLRENDFTPPVRFTAFRLYNNLIEPGEYLNGRVILPYALPFLNEINLNHNENFFSVEFTALSYASPSQNRYQFRLEGLHDQWFDVLAGERSAVFTGLSPRKYVLRVRGANPDGVWSESSLEINILPAFYQTVWFRFLLIFIMASIVLLIYRLRLQSLTRQQIRLQSQVEEKTDELQQQNRILSTQRDEITRQRDQVVDMTRMVHEADERKLRFFTGISHEIRTPLTLILGPVEQLVQNEKLPVTAKEMLNRVLRNSQSLYKLINQLLDFRKIDSGLMPVTLSQGEINTRIKNQLELHQDIISNKNLTVEFKLDDSIKACYFDFDLVEKIFSNLLTNAIKYSSTDARIVIETSLNSFDGKNQIELRVKDSGVGIPPDEQERIFERFYRASHSRRKSNEGIGIGLAFSRDLARLHGGDLKLEHSNEKGSTFLFNLPYNLEIDLNDIAIHHEVINEFSISEISNSKLEHDKFSVLIIEDNNDLRAYIKDGFKGFTIYEASDGDNGLKMALEHLPDIVVSDILMPGLNGFEVCRRLKQNPDTYHIPVLLLTALGAAEHHKLGVDAGADDYMVKPFSVQLLIGKVRNILVARERFRNKLLMHYQEPAELQDCNGNPILDTVNAMVLENLKITGFGVEEISRKLNMSRSTFYRKISSLTGISPIEFVRRIRLRESCRLLKSDSSLTINEVAFMVGFEDVDYYRNCFKKVYDKTPTEYLKSDS